jgi:phosphoribosylanthranilate isomerase
LSARVKICGVTRVADALEAARLGAAWIGLNFAPESPRRIDVATAAEIAAAVRAGFPAVGLVGVFVNEPAGRVLDLLDRLGLDLAQLHGEEPEADHRALGRRAVRVFRGVPERSTIESAGEPALFLVDAAGGRRRGGTGTAWSYAALAGLRFPAPVLIAGGIDPGNAARALAGSGADGVDVASGVESAPGIKDPEKMAALMREVASVPTAPR